MSNRLDGDFGRGHMHSGCGIIADNLGYLSLHLVFPLQQYTQIEKESPMLEIGSKAPGFTLTADDGS